MIRIRNIIVIFFSMLIRACSGKVRANNVLIDRIHSLTITVTATGTSTPITTLTITPIQNNPTSTHTPTYSPIGSDTVISTGTSIPTDTPYPIVVQDRVYGSAGFVTAPVLLYHQISNDGSENRYYVTVDDFRQQMQTIRDLDYETITPVNLANALIHVGELPDCPVVISFDDGNLSAYQNAFPIMHELGFVGPVYIYVDKLDSVHHVNAEQLQEMSDNGWEIGSHSMSHADLTENASMATYELLQYELLQYELLMYELLQSRLTLELALDEPVVTFAYPYRRTNSNIRGINGEYGYIAGIGLGPSWEHSLDTITYLSRIEV